MSFSTITKNVEKWKTTVEVSDALVGRTVVIDARVSDREINWLIEPQENKLNVSYVYQSKNYGEVRVKVELDLSDGEGYEYSRHETNPPDVLHLHLVKAGLWLG